MARGDDLTSTKEIIGDEAWTIVEVKYPCTNPACTTDILVQSVPGYSIIDSQAIVGGYVLAGNDATRFDAGRLGRDGIWRPPVP